MDVMVYFFLRSRSFTRGLLPLFDRILRFFFPGGSLAVLGALHRLCHGRVLPRQRKTCGQGRPVDAASLHASFTQSLLSWCVCRSHSHKLDPCYFSQDPLTLIRTVKEHWISGSFPVSTQRYKTWQSIYRFETCSCRRSSSMMICPSKLWHIAAG